MVAFTDALLALGWVHGRNLLLESRLIDRTASNGAALAAELARMDLDLVVAGALPFALEVRRANPAMAMVIVTCPGMVSNGFAASLERPGGNVTGMDELPPGLTAKRLTLLKSAAPTVARVALLSTTPGRGGHEIQLADAEQAAGTLGIRVRPLPCPVVRRAGVGTGLDRRRWHGRAPQLPGRAFAPSPAAHRRLRRETPPAGHVSAQPGELRIHHPERYYLTVNAGTAARLGLTLSERFLAQADRVLR